LVYEQRCTYYPTWRTAGGGYSRGSQYDHTRVFLGFGSGDISNRPPLPTPQPPTPTPQPTPQPGLNPWNADTVYWGGDLVYFNGRQWRASWWTLGDAPGTDMVWEDLGPVGA